jgi:hypothetical protein
LTEGSAPAMVMDASYAFSYDNDNAARHESAGNVHPDFTTGNRKPEERSSRFHDRKLEKHYRMSILVAFEKFEKNDYLTFFIANQALISCPII